MKKKEEQDYLEHFNKIFGTETNKHLRLNMPMLKIIFQNFGENIYTPNKEYNQIRGQIIKILDELEGTFTEKQKELFDEYKVMENQLTEDVEEQLFMFGYIVASKLSEETKINE